MPLLALPCVAVRYAHIFYRAALLSSVFEGYGKGKHIVRGGNVGAVAQSRAFKMFVLLDDDVGVVQQLCIILNRAYIL